MSRYVAPADPGCSWTNVPFGALPATWATSIAVGSLTGWNTTTWSAAGLGSGSTAVAYSTWIKPSHETDALVMSTVATTAGGTTASLPPLSVAGKVVDPSSPAVVVEVVAASVVEVPSAETVVDGAVVGDGSLPGSKITVGSTVGSGGAVGGGVGGSVGSMTVALVIIGRCASAPAERPAIVTPAMLPTPTPIAAASIAQRRPVGLAGAGA